MEIIIAESAGFCFGVKRAIEITEQALKKYHSVYSLGHIVHNKFVNQMLIEKGLIIADDIHEIPQKQKVIIRAHGATPDEIKVCKERELEIIDATCPNVKKVHEIVAKYSKEGYSIVIIGDKNHPEVMGEKGWSTNDVLIVGSEDQIDDVSNSTKVCVVSQTTMNIEKNIEIIEKIKNKAKECIAFDTICRATEERQNALKVLANEVDEMIVIGDKESANSARLYEISRKICKNTQFVENIDELCLNFPQKSCKIGVTAGASTPKFLIDSVVAQLKKECEMKGLI